MSRELDLPKGLFEITWHNVAAGRAHGNGRPLRFIRHRAHQPSFASTRLTRLSDSASLLGLQVCLFLGKVLCQKHSSVASFMWHEIERPLRAGVRGHKLRESHLLPNAAGRRAKGALIVLFVADLPCTWWGRSLLRIFDS